MDIVNALALLNLNLRRSVGDKSAPSKYEPIYNYPGSPFAPPPTKRSLISTADRLGGYRPGTRDEIRGWLAARGLPTPPA